MEIGKPTIPIRKQPIEVPREVVEGPDGRRDDEQHPAFSEAQQGVRQNGYRVKRVLQNVEHTSRRKAPQDALALEFFPVQSEIEHHINATPRFEIGADSLAQPQSSRQVAQVRSDIESYRSHLQQRLPDKPARVTLPKPIDIERCHNVFTSQGSSDCQLHQACDLFRWGRTRGAVYLPPFVQQGRQIAGIRAEHCGADPHSLPA
jgi:hypothetical protein